MKRFPFTDLSVEVEEGGGGATEMKNRGGDSAHSVAVDCKREKGFLDNCQ